MKKISILSILAIMLAVNVNAKVWRVSNRVINGLTVDADFTTLQAGIDGANPGDTLYLMGSPSSYGSGSINKKLTIIGPGYWLNENDTTQAVKENATISQLTFHTGCEGSKVSGVYFQNSTNAEGFKIITINTDSITIEKCRLVQSKYIGTGKLQYGIFINDTVYNIVIQQNWIHIQNTGNHSTSSGILHGIYFNGIPKSSVVRNNFLRSYRSYNHGSYYSCYMAVEDTAIDLNFYNNIIWGNTVMYWSNQLNNIYISGSNGGGGNLMIHNIGSGSQYPSNPPDLNNMQNVNMDSVFVDYDLYVDKGYLLKPNSPASGAGVNSGDCGVFGYQSGGIPYVLSGLSAIPAIYATEVESIGPNSVSVTIKAKSHNQHK